MDETLIILFGELYNRIQDCKERNPGIDMDGIERISILIQAYLDVFKKVEPIELLEPSPTPTQPRILPKGHLGPSSEMLKYAEKQDTNSESRLQRVINLAKELDAIKDIPYFM